MNIFVVGVCVREPNEVRIRGSLAVAAIHRDECSARFRSEAANARQNFMGELEALHFYRISQWKCCSYLHEILGPYRVFCIRTLYLTGS